MEKRKQYYSLQHVRELKRVNEIDEVNELLKKNWLLLEVTTKNDNQIFLIGRVD